MCCVNLPLPVLAMLDFARGPNSYAEIDGDGAFEDAPEWFDLDEFEEFNYESVLRTSRDGRLWLEFADGTGIQNFYWRIAPVAPEGSVAAPHLCFNSPHMCYILGLTCVGGNVPLGLRHLVESAVVAYKNQEWSRHALDIFDRAVVDARDSIPGTYPSKV